MAIQKLNKTFISEQVLQASEMNQLSQKIDELVDGVNNNTDNIPDISGLATKQEVTQAVSDKLTKEQADGYYQFKGDYALKSEIPDTSQLATKTELGKKLDATTYNSEKANFATKDEIGDIGTILDNIIGG